MMTIFVTKLSLLRMKKENKTKLLFNASIYSFWFSNWLFGTNVHNR